MLAVNIFLKMFRDYVANLRLTYLMAGSEILIVYAFPLLSRAVGAFCAKAADMHEGLRGIGGRARSRLTRAKSVRPRTYGALNTQDAPRFMRRAIRARGHERCR